MVRTLIIEDKVSEAQRIKAALETLGHSVVHITGANELRNGVIVSRNHEIINPGEFDVAFVDATLDGLYHGWHLAPLLLNAGVVCIAISAGGQFNPMVQAAGAQLAMPKEEVVPDLEDGRLDLGDIIQKYGRKGASP
jgi:CheY-like chemotaxis protein